MNESGPLSTGPCTRRPVGRPPVAEAAGAAGAADGAGAADAGLATRTTTTGPFTVQQGYATDAQGGGVWLTRQDQIMLAPWRLNLVCVPLVSERTP